MSVLKTITASSYYNIRGMYCISLWSDVKVLDGTHGNGGKVTLATLRTQYYWNNHVILF